MLTTDKLSELACLALYLMYEKKNGRDSVWYPYIKAGGSSSCKRSFHTAYPSCFPDVSRCFFPLLCTNMANTNIRMLLTCPFDLSHSQALDRERGRSQSGVQCLLLWEEVLQQAPLPCPSCLLCFPLLLRPVSRQGEGTKG